MGKLGKSTPLSLADALQWNRDFIKALPRDRRFWQRMDRRMARITAAREATKESRHG